MVIDVDMVTLCVFCCLYAFLAGEMTRHDREGGCLAGEGLKEDIEEKKK